MSLAHNSLKRLAHHWLLASGFLMMASVASQANETDFKRLERLSTQAEAKGDLSQAIRLSLRMLDIKPNDIPSMLALSGLYGKADQPEQQLVWTQKILTLQPNHFDALINQGNAMAAVGNFKGARVSFGKAQSLVPISHLPSYSLGVLAQSQNRDEEALIFFQKALNLSPSFEDALLNLAVSYANLGRTKEAVAALDRLLTKNPGALDARQLRSELTRK